MNVHIRISHCTSKRQPIREKGTLMHCWWESKLVVALGKTVWRFLKKLKIELPYDPAIPLLSIYPKKTKTLIQKDTCDQSPPSSLLDSLNHQKADSRSKKNYNELSPHTGHNGHHQKIYKQQMLEWVWRKGNPPTLLVGM